VIIITGELSGRSGGHREGVQLTSNAFASVVSLVVPLRADLRGAAVRVLDHITWAYYGAKAASFLARESKGVLYGFKIFYLAMAVVGCTMQLGSIVDIADALLFIMAIPNLIGVYLLMPVVKRELAGYEARLAPVTAPRTRRLLWLTIVVGLLAAATPLANVALDYRARAALFPVLLDPAAPRGLAFVSSFGRPVVPAPLPSQLAPGDSGRLALRVTLDEGRWPGVTLDEPVADWRGWRAIVVEVANPSDEPLGLTLRVNDRAHDNRFEDRYNQHLALQPRARHRFEFPLEAIERAPEGRTMDLAQVQKLLVFHVGPAPGRSFYLERIALVR
jgi:hypothetical protein